MVIVVTAVPFVQRLIARCCGQRHRHFGISFVKYEHDTQVEFQTSKQKTYYAQLCRLKGPLVLSRTPREMSWPYCPFGGETLQAQCLDRPRMAEEY